MKWDFWSFVIGVLSLLLAQHLSMIPFYRRQRIRKMLLQRAEMYQKRARKFGEEGNFEEAEKLRKECYALLVQVEEMGK